MVVRLSEQVLEVLPYFEKEMMALSDLVSPGAVCFDVGAAGGIYALVLSRLVGPSGRVFAFEPRPRSFAFLRRVLRRPNVSVHRIALSHRTGRQTMVVPRRYRVPFSTRSFLQRELDRPVDHYYPEFTGARRIEVETTTLDDFMAGHGIDRLDLLKIDVEGSEPWVLFGGRRTISAHRPIILCEVEARHLVKYGHRAGELFAWLAALDYRPHVYADGILRPVNGPDRSENDYLFLPS